ncbi:MAG: DinB family protein, partial [Actinomycetota bacterium]
MLRYNKWATTEIINACRELSEEQLDTLVPGASGSVRELLLHVVGGQQTLVLRTKGRQHEGELTRRSPWPGFDQLIEEATRSSDELISLAESMDSDSEVDLPYVGKVYRFPKSFFLVHAMEHGVEHRTEIKVALGHIGVETPDLDGWSYATAAG